MSYPLRSPDVAQHLGRKSSSCRFEISGKLPATANVDEFDLVFGVGPLHERRSNLYYDTLQNDAYHGLERRFFAEAGPRVLEIGSRSRSGIDRRAKLEGKSYTGLDIAKGPNVDVVGDAHELSTVLGEQRFDAAFALSVFEHILMPWKVVSELNKVLDNDAIVFVGTHQTFPMHEVPWDYLRFSDTAWDGIFNKQTGFEIIDTALGEPTNIVPAVQHPANRDVPKSNGYLLVGVLARKISEAHVSWDVSLPSVVKSYYPN